MQSVTVREAREKISQLLDAVAHDELVAIPIEATLPDEDPDSNEDQDPSVHSCARTSVTCLHKPWVDEGHSDLRGRIVPTVDFVEGGGRSFIEDTHGTAVAGVKAVDFVINAGVHILNLSLGGPRSTPRPPRLMSQA